MLTQAAKKITTLKPNLAWQETTELNSRSVMLGWKARLPEAGQRHDWRNQRLPKIDFIKLWLLDEVRVVQVKNIRALAGFCITNKNNKIFSMLKVRFLS